MIFLEHRFKSYFMKINSKDIYRSYFYMICIDIYSCAKITLSTVFNWAL